MCFRTLIRREAAADGSRVLFMGKFSIRSSASSEMRQLCTLGAKREQYQENKQYLLDNIPIIACRDLIDFCFDPRSRSRLGGTAGSSDILP